LILAVKRSGLLTRTAGDGRRFIVRADDKLSAVVELEREVLTVTFYLESIQ
jgi:hypothetical protein